MKLGVFRIAAVLAGGLLAGCGGDGTPGESGTAPAPKTVANVGKPLGSIKVGDSAICVVCSKEGGDHGKTPEPAVAIIDYKGKTYAFCNESEKAEFISSPAKYADPAN
jgi:YHS domain-containing protein